MRNFTIGRSLTEDELLGPGGLERVSELLGSLKPFVSLPASETTFELFPTLNEWMVPWDFAEVKFSPGGAGNNWGSVGDLRRAVFVCAVLRWQGEPAAALVT